MYTIEFVKDYLVSSLPSREEINIALGSDHDYKLKISKKLHDYLIFLINVCPEWITFIFEINIDEKRYSFVLLNKKYEVHGKLNTFNNDTKTVKFNGKAVKATIYSQYVVNYNDLIER